MHDDGWTEDELKVLRERGPVVTFDDVTVDIVDIVDGCFVFSSSTDGGRIWNDEKLPEPCTWVELNPEIRMDEIKWPDDPPVPSYRAREGLDAPTEITADDASALGRALRFRKG